MPSNEEIEQLQSRLQIHRQTLSHLLQQQAMHSSAYVPPSTFHGINEARQQIKEIKKILCDWNISVDDLPDDEARTFTTKQSYSNSSMDAQSSSNEEPKSVNIPQSPLRPITIKNFESEVINILRLLGYNVQQNININGNQISVYGEYKTGVITLRLMVECRDYGEGKLIGIEEISKFAGLLAVARNTGIIDKGLFVTTHGYTPEARSNAHHAGIELTTYREISTKLIDFSSYIDRIVTEFEASSVSKYYIDLSGTDVEDYLGAEDIVFYRPIDDIIIKRLSDKDHNKIALLGNFGTGKSTFCRKFAHSLALAHKQNPISRIPIVINLSDYDSKLHIQQLILNALQFRYNLNITNTICQELQRIGRFLLIFDGFDEMAMRVDSDTIRENIREINKIADISENKFIVTCRTHFFRDRVQAEVLTDFDILFIPEWGEKELKEYLQKRFGEEWEKYLERISGTHNLPELAQTPLFLEMIVETLPKLGDEVKRIELYQIYTDNWIKDQSRRKGARLPTEQRKQFVEELAIKLYLEGIFHCHHKEFVSILRKKFEIDDAAQMDYFRSDVQTCTFLTRDANGNYGFRHKSFMEFFVARRLANEIKQGLYENFRAKLLTIEIRGFLVDYLLSSPPAELLKEWLQIPNEQILRENVLSLLPLLKINVSDDHLESELQNSAETKLIFRFIQGEPDAFDAVYREYCPYVIRYVAALARQNEISTEAENIKNLTEEVVTETFLRVWQQRDKMNYTEEPQRYFALIARNIYADRVRRERREASNVSIDDIPIDYLYSVDDSREINAFMDREMLSTAIKKLSDREQRIIVESYFLNKSISDIAALIGTSVEAAQKARYRALQKLREHLKIELSDNY